MFCNQCGNEIGVNASFCRSCGVKLKSKLDSKPNSKPVITTKKSLMILFFTLSSLVIFGMVYWFFIHSPKIEVEAYYPQSGSPGTYVLLELNQKIAEDKIQVLYGEEEIQGSRITDSVIGVNVPINAISDDFVIKYKKREVKVPFVILDEELVTLLEENIKPSSQVQEIRSDEGISLTLPGNFLQKDSAVTISKVENPPVIKESPIDAYEVYDISIEGMTQLNENIQISMKYDPEWFDEGVSVKDYLEPKRWDEENEMWVDLYYRVDEETNTVHFLTDHLSFFTLSIKSVKLLGLLKAGAAVGTVAYALEWLANDVYISPQGNIRILYSKEGISKMFPDKKWEQALSKFSTSPHLGYRYIYPFMVQDIGAILEASLKSYIDAGFSDPTKDRFLGSVFTRTIKVKIDSYWNFYSGGEFNYSAFWDQINIPAEIIRFEVYDTILNNPSDYDEAEIYLTHVLAHELFHVIQRPYYGMLTDFRKGKHLWWMEATADYAANDVAWNRTNSVLNERLGNRYFDYPLNTTGKKTGSYLAKSTLDYEYLTAVFVRYLIEEVKCDFKEIIKYVADKGFSTEPLDSIHSFAVDNTGYKHDFDMLYADFVVWMLNKGELTVADFNDMANKNMVAEGIKKILIPDKKATIMINKTEDDKEGVFIYKSKEGTKGSEHKIEKVTVLFENSMNYEMNVEEGDILYFVIPNTKGSSRNVTATINLKDAEIVDGSKLAEHKVLVEENYTAKVWSVKVENSDWSIEPNLIENGQFNTQYRFKIKGQQISSEIKNVQINYDFGDGKEKSKGSISGTVQSDGTFEADISYTYEISKDTVNLEVNQYTVKANIMDGKDQIGSAEASVTLNPIEVSILAPRTMIYELKDGAAEAEHTFNAVATPEGEYRFEWDFGDGSPKKTTKGDKSKISHTYSKTGKFYPEVTVYHSDGNIKFDNDSITVILDDGEKKDEFTLNVSNVTVKMNQDYEFTAYLNGEETKETSFRVEEKDGGSFYSSKEGIYKAPLNIGTYHVTATYTRNKELTATAVVNIEHLGYWELVDVQVGGKTGEYVAFNDDIDVSQTSISWTREWKDRDAGSLGFWGSSTALYTWDELPDVITPGEEFTIPFKAEIIDTTGKPGSDYYFSINRKLLIFQGEEKDYGWTRYRYDDEDGKKQFSANIHSERTKKIEGEYIVDNFHIYTSFSGPRVMHDNGDRFLVRVKSSFSDQASVDYIYEFVIR